MKVPKQISLRTALVMVLIGIIITSGIFYVFAATPSSTFYISSGIYPGAPSYTIWKEGSNYFAKNRNGQLKYSGTNFSLVVNNAINSLDENGGLIYISEGVYYPDSPIVLKARVVVEGAGMKATQLRLADGANCNVFEWKPVGIELMAGIRNIHIFGNKDNNANGNGIWLEGETWDFETYRVWIHSAKELGLRADNVWGHRHWNLIVEECGGSGVYIEQGYASFDMCRFGNNHEQGVSIDYGRRITFTGCEFQENSYNGLDLGGYLEGGVPKCMCTITGNIFKGNGVNGTDNNDAQIRLADNVRHSTITGNTFEGYYAPEAVNRTNYGIYFASVNARYNTIVGNTFRGHAIAGMGSEGAFDYHAYNTIHSNVGWVTESSGFHDASNGDWIFHGLVQTPNSVVLTVNATDANYFVQVQAVNATAFQIYLYDATAGAAETVDKTIYWIAKVQP